MDKHTIKNAIEDKREKIESEGGIVCDNFDLCHKRATRNIQECWVSWRVRANGNYSVKPYDIEETNGDNFHLCDDCEQ